MAKFIYVIRKDGYRRSYFAERVLLVALLVASAVTIGAQVWVNHLLTVKI